MPEVKNNGKNEMSQQKKNNNISKHEQRKIAVRDWIKEMETLMEENRETERLSQDDFTIRVNA